MASGNTTITATIARVSANGFQTREDPGRWLNISKYVSPKPTIPPIGTGCRITVDGAGFVRAIEMLGEEQPSDTPDVPPDAPGATERPSATPATSEARMAALQAAAAFLAGSPDAKSTDVLDVAERFEAWLVR